MSVSIGQLTGRTRYREGWRGKMILQVEFMDSEWMGEVCRFRNWRDASVDDVLSRRLLLAPLPEQE